MAGRILPASWPRPPQPQDPAPAPVPPRQFRSTQTRRTGDKLLWNGYTGIIMRETANDYVEVLIGTRTCRLPGGESQ